jgi:hypothetical protein
MNGVMLSMANSIASFYPEESLKTLTECAKLTANSLSMSKSQVISIIKEFNLALQFSREEKTFYLLAIVDGELKYDTFSSELSFVSHVEELVQLARKLSLKLRTSPDMPAYPFVFDYYDSDIVGGNMKISNLKVSKTKPGPKFTLDDELVTAVMNLSTDESEHFSG